MKVLMLGWEYPPHISGGLGTACQGLTTALAGLGVEIDFVVPRFYGDEDTAHMRLLGANQPRSGSTGGVAPRSGGSRAVGTPTEAGTAASVGSRGEVGAGGGWTAGGSWATGAGAEAAGGGAGGPDVEPGAAGSDAIAGIQRFEVPARLKPYLTPEAYARMVGSAELRRMLDPESEGGAVSAAAVDEALRTGNADLPEAAAYSGAAGASGESLTSSAQNIGLETEAEPAHYGGDLFSEVDRYARSVAALTRDRSFDLVHAHDWLTWPAAMAVAAERGVPLVVHAHSLEFDRSGANPDPRIFAIERAGLRAADRVVAVSYYTRGIIHREHGIPLDRIAVVHNGVYSQAEIQSYRSRQPSPRKTVLFLGRVTFQKGPEYFVQAAAKVVPHVPEVEFVVVGSGDMLPAMIQQVAELGLGRSFRFTGFLKGPEVERMFSMADLYVMPSVSEPFGISALEAMSYDTPVIISKQSGVSELLQHALKVDAWDVDYLANLMIGALKYPELRADIVSRGREEVRRIHWDAAGEATVAVYRALLEG